MSKKQCILSVGQDGVTQQWKITNWCVAIADLFTIWSFALLEVMTAWNFAPAETTEAPHKLDAIKLGDA